MHLMQAMDKWSGVGQREMFKLREISLVEFVEMIRLLGNSTVFGHDQLDSQMTKLATASLYKPLNHLINLSIKTKRFASIWNIGWIVPLHKGKGLNLNTLESFRPVLLLSVTLKLVERAVHRQVVKFMEQSKQFNPLSNSYRKHHGTTTTLIKIADSIFSATDRNEISMIMMIYVTSAFDCVQMDIILDKLRIYNLGEEDLEWFRDFLTHCSTYVMIGGKYSTMREDRSPSVFGPWTSFIHDVC